MKLHQVKTLNLNSLYGEHVIDFEKDLDNASLFLILGQTGAGKSTILDAICLGLFGRTPRLTRATGRPETDARHVMSYGTGRCRAEVFFSLKDADQIRHHYRAVWECRRAYEKASGSLQDPIRSLYKIDDQGDEHVLVSDNRLKYFEPHFEEILEGMTVDDFQRSILLAQGEFAAFLKADEAVKANILEKLTSTDEYREIGQRASEKRRVVERELKDLLARLDGLQILDEEDEKALREHFAELEGALDLARADLEKMTESLAWISRREEIEQAIEAAKKDHAERVKALSGRKEERERLELDRRCRPAEKTLEKLGEERASITSLEESTTKLDEELVELRKKREAEKSALEAGEQELGKQRDALENVRQELERARNIVGRQAAAHQELERVESRRKDATQTFEKASKEVEVLTRAIDLGAKMQEMAEKSFAEVENIASLGEHIEALAAQVGHLDEVASRIARAREKHASAKEAATTCREELAAIEESLAAARASVAPQREALEAARARLDAVLDGAESSSKRRAGLEKEVDAAREALTAVDEALRLHEQLVEQRMEQAENKRTHANQEREIKSRNEELVGFKEELDEQNENLEGILIGLRSVEDQLVLKDHRKKLTDEDPCPLCGSHDHPLLVENAAEEVEAQLEADRQKLAARKKTLLAKIESVQKEVREAELDIASLDGAKARTEAQRVALRKDIDRLMEHYNGARHRVGFSALEIFPGSKSEQNTLRDAFIEHRAELKLDSERCREALVSLDDAVETFDVAREALAKVSEDERRVELERSQIASKVELLDASLNEAKGHVAEVESQREQVSSKLSKRFEEAGIALESLGEDRGPDFGRGLEQARAKKARFEEARTALEEARREQERLTRERELARERVERARSAKDKVEEEFTSREAVVKSLQEERETLLDGRAPDEVQKEFTSAIEEAESKVKSAREAFTAASGKLERLEGSLEEQTRRLTASKEALAALEAQLAKVCAELDLDEESLRQGLLSHEERESLEESFAEAEQKIQDAAREQERLTERATAHLEKRPEDERIESFTSKKWEKEHKRLRDEVDAHLSERGALAQQVEAQEKAKKRSEHIREELDALQSEYRTWETIHRLIGTRDGEGFKLFAQSLNLQELVDRANMRLDRLAPRYSLAVAVGEQGEPKLDFAVIDHHQADAHRPLTTLSGGETFLVSLALALGLSDFRRVQMPVETLLLDEGFGTLDQETLDVAMATLRQLQQESVQQIGIISHVESLKERVDTRIVVEKLGNGRSTLFVEGNGARHGLAV